MGVGSYLARTFGFGSGAGSASLALPPAPTPAQLGGLFGPPKPPDMTRDGIVSEIWVQPYHGPGDFDREGGETAESRRRYRRQYRDVAVTKASRARMEKLIKHGDPLVILSDALYDGINVDAILLREA